MLFIFMLIVYQAQSQTPLFP